MALKELLKSRNMSVYQCAKESKVPYTTVSDLVNGKTKIGRCSAETVYKLSKVFHVTMEELLENHMETEPDASYRGSFEIFKSNVCHLVKDKGDIDFIVDILRENEIRMYWNRKWYPESFYLLAMVDYLCRENDLPICRDYDDIRKHKLAEPIYPRDIMVAVKLNPALDQRKSSRDNAIPEFLKYNIVEGEVRNVY